MAGRRKPTPIEAFELNISDAEWLLSTAAALQDVRIRRMRAELRDTIGEALHVSSKDRAQLDRIESNDLFIVIKPGAAIGRAHVNDLTPLYRQAIVVAAAAVEAYVSDAVIIRIGPVLRDGQPLPKYLNEMTITIEEWNRIDQYDRRRRGLLEVALRSRIAEMSSADPDPMGKLLSMIRLDNWTRQIDQFRKVTRNTTHGQLKALATRRNTIAHTGDRQGRGRALITLEAASSHVENARSIVEAIEAILGPQESAE